MTFITPIRTGDIVRLTPGRVPLFRIVDDDDTRITLVHINEKNKMSIGTVIKTWTKEEQEFGEYGLHVSLKSYADVMWPEGRTPKCPLFLLRKVHL